MNKPASKLRIVDWRIGKGGDVTEALLRGGLEIGEGSIDINPSLVKGIVADSAAFADRLIPGAGKVVNVPGSLAKGMNHFLWEVVHPAFKLSLASQEYARLLGKGMEPKLAAETAATFSNDIFGGLNWRRLSLDADTSLGVLIIKDCPVSGSLISDNSLINFLLLTALSIEVA